MTADFEGCPNEIVESIVMLLDVQDIGNIRLTCRMIAAKATQDHFKSFFRKKRLDMTESHLECFAAATRSNGLGCLVQELTIVWLVYDTPSLEEILRKETKSVTRRTGPMFMTTQVQCSREELEKARRDLDTLIRRRADQIAMQHAGNDVELLVEAFNHVAAATISTPGTVKITLEVNVYRDDADTRLQPLQGGSWKSSSLCASTLLRTTMSALAKSKFSIGELDAFSEQRRCNVPCSELSSIDYTDAGLARALRNVKAFSISISHRMIDETEEETTRSGDPVVDGITWHKPSTPRDPDILKTEAGDAANFSGLPKLLALCPNVERMDLHFYSLPLYKIARADLHNERHLQRIFEAGVTFPNLSGLRLRGFCIREAELEAFLKSSAITMLVLQNLFLQDGSYGALFEQCVGEEAGMQHLFFDDLFQDGRLLYFTSEPGKPKFPSACHTKGSNTLQRRGEAVGAKPIKYRLYTERALGSPQAYRWRELRKQEYGP